MGVCFNWFKDYEVVPDMISMGIGTYTEYNLKYIDGDSTSHSYGNRTKLQNIFRKYLNTEIPTIPDYYQESINVNLIEPSEMSKLCSKLLVNKCDYDLEDMEDRIEWIKKLSDDGYYVTYDVD
jgi:hypothetical protein